MARNGNRNNGNGNGGGNGGTGAGGNGGGNHGGGGNNVGQARSAGGGGGNDNRNRGGGGNGNGGVSAGQNNGNHNNGNGGVSAGHAAGHNGNRNNGGGAAGNGGTSAPVPVSSWTNDYEQWQREHPNPGHSPGTPDNANYAAWLKQHPNPGNSQGGNRSGNGGAAAPAGNGNDEGTLVISHNSVAPSGAADPVPAIDGAQPAPIAPAQPVQSTGGIAAPGSATSQPTTYTVQPGDTLSDIAEETGISLARLKALNPQIRNADLIFPGQAIRVEANGPAPNAGSGGISVPAQGNGPGGIAAPADAGFPTSSTYPPADGSVQKAAARLKKWGAKQGWGDGNGGVTADPAQRAMTVASAPDTNPLNVKDAKHGRKGFRVVSAPK